MLESYENEPCHWLVTAFLWLYLLATVSGAVWLTWTASDTVGPSCSPCYKHGYI